MIRRPLIWQLFPSYLLVTFAALVAVAFYVSYSFRQVYVEQSQASLNRLGPSLIPEVANLLKQGDLERLRTRLDQLAAAMDLRLTLVDIDGTVLADTSELPSRMENHGARPEIAEASASGRGNAYRYSTTLREKMQYSAWKIGPEASPVAVLRAGLPGETLDAALLRMYTRLLLSALLVAMLAGLVSYVASNRIIRPLEIMKAGAERFANGELEQRLPVPQSQEFASLAEALNKMAQQLDERIQTVIHQRNEQEAVLSSMRESVLAVDLSGRVISMNAAAARLLGVNPLKVQGRDLQLVVRNSALQQFAAQALRSREPLESEIVLHRPREQVLQVHGAVLRDAENAAMGAVIVLNDVTRLRRLEQVRRDFVANVSHELKTPITSIKGFVETLLEGGLDSPADAERFLRIVAKQADRLHRIIDDLLLLSSIEQQEKMGEEYLQHTSLAPIIRSAVQLCAASADRKEIEIYVRCPESIRAQVNPALLEQGLVNLIDNAIKYSDPGAAVEIEARENGEEVLIEVRDRGCGIPSEHLPRLFERFYRVDKARSRSVGGTGLGLAIVKHIAQSHGGHVTVTSAAGVGSTFAIHLPLPHEALSA